MKRIAIWNGKELVKLNAFSYSHEKPFRRNLNNLFKERKEELGNISRAFITSVDLFLWKNLLWYSILRAEASLNVSQRKLITMSDDVTWFNLPLLMDRRRCCWRGTAGTFDRRAHRAIRISSRCCLVRRCRSHT